MVHLITSYNGMISLVEMQDKLNFGKKCNLIENKVLPLVSPHFPVSNSFPHKTTAPSIDRPIVNVFK